MNTPLFYVSLKLFKYSQLSPCGFPAITDKIQIPMYRGLTENDSRYYGLSLFRTQNNVPKVPTNRRVECMQNLPAGKIILENCLFITINSLLFQNHNQYFCCHPQHPHFCFEVLFNTKTTFKCLLSILEGSPSYREFGYCTISEKRQGAILDVCF